MSSEAPFTSPHAHEIRRVRSLLEDIARGLRRQADLLRVRGIAPPPTLLDDLAAAEGSLTTLAGVLDKQATEIAQLRALIKTYALINSSLDADTVLTRSMDEIITLTGAERGFILMQTPDGALQVRIARGLDPNARGEEISRTIVQQVLSSGQPLLTDNAVSDPRLFQSETMARYGLRSVLCVPLRSREEIGGVIYVDNRVREGIFTDRERTLLMAFSNQISAAIENALLFQQVQETLQEILRVSALMESVFASIDSGVITADSENRVITLNRAAGRIIGVAPSEAAGWPLEDLLRVPGLTGHLLAAREKGRRAAFESEAETLGGRRLVLNIRLSPLRGGEFHHENGGAEIHGTALVIDDLTAQRDREETLELMQRYLPPGLVENITQIADLAMGGERREITCVFISTCQFHLFPPGLRPPELMETLNAYLDTATACIHAAQGIIDKYMGNEIMVLFNTQLNPIPDHALQAVLMTRMLCAAYRSLYDRLGITPERDHFTVGIHTGVATLGNVGSHNRRNFTAIGDSINLTKRIQESAALGEILISGETYAQLTPYLDTLNGLRFEEREPIIARGRQTETRLFEVVRLP